MAQIGIQGETIPLIFDYTYDGTPISSLQTISNIECQLCEEGSSGAIKLTKLPISPATEGRIAIGTSGKYEALLTQVETFALPRTVKYQFKILDSNNKAIADDIGVFTLGAALSKNALGGS